MRPFDRKWWTPVVVGVILWLAAIVAVVGAALSALLLRTRDFPGARQGMRTAGDGRGGGRSRSAASVA
jgi:hypothetical protein